MYLYLVHVCVCMHICELVPKRPVLGSLEAGVTDGCQRPDARAGSWTLVLWKNRKCSWTWAISTFLPFVFLVVSKEGVQGNSMWTRTSPQSHIDKRLRDCPTFPTLAFPPKTKPSASGFRIPPLRLQTPLPCPLSSCLHPFLSCPFFNLIHALLPLLPSSLILLVLGLSPQDDLLSTFLKSPVLFSLKSNVRVLWSSQELQVP